ncbi:hypothetical protein ACM26V_04840 [Salipaludibacillus sp. HK11]|uniref:hypothetical protein n=1 Tax=Salipaludibacillus sp. HK11 TaxID=3394320 RepID=UPI0039FBAB58
MKFKLLFLLIIGASLLLGGCARSTMEDTSDTLQHFLLRGVITEVNNTVKEITVEGETEKVKLRVSENSEMVNQEEEVIQLGDLEKGIEVSVSWGSKEELEKLEILEQ